MNHDDSSIETEISNKKHKREDPVVTTIGGFTYSPLDTDFNEIRILTLLSGDTEMVQCTLEHASLINPPEFIALSYCWGDPSITTAVEINGVLVQVTTNLESALKHLRAKGYTRLWVDAVCINQQDKSERNQQLLWMGSIYRRAHEVAAWTGGDCGLAIEFVHKFKECHDFPDVSDGDSDGDSNGDSDSRGSSIDQKDVSTTVVRREEGDFMHLLARPYWQRIWIIQGTSADCHIDMVLISERFPAQPRAIQKPP
jgi:hypothetical protein